MEYNFTTDNFEAEVVKAQLPVLVDFYADWCGPCKIMAPVVEDVAERFEGRLKVGKCNIDENIKLTQKYRIVSIPTFKIFKGGEVVATLMGAMAAEEFIEQIEKEI
jgi:thioredoxin 1